MLTQVKTYLLSLNVCQAIFQTGPQRLLLPCSKEHFYQACPLSAVFSFGGKRKAQFIGDYIFMKSTAIAGQTFHGSATSVTVHTTLWWALQDPRHFFSTHCHFSVKSMCASCLWCPASGCVCFFLKEDEAVNSYSFPIINWLFQHFPFKIPSERMRLS